MQDPLLGPPGFIGTLRGVGGKGTILPFLGLIKSRPPTPPSPYHPKGPYDGCTLCRHPYVYPRGSRAQVVGGVAEATRSYYCSLWDYEAYELGTIGYLDLLQDMFQKHAGYLTLQLVTVP